jgi:thiol-disulfide isomerase/thioredoxin
MQFKKLGFLIISATLFITGCSDSKKTLPVDEHKFTLQTQNPEKKLTFEKKNDIYKIKELEGKIILIDFWATWCPPCKAEIPHLNNLTKKYKDKFAIVSLNMGKENGSLETKEELEPFLFEHEISYLVVNDKANFQIASLMGGVKSIPTMFMIGKDGKIVQKYVGIAPEEMIETDIKRALGEE